MTNRFQDFSAAAAPDSRLAELFREINSGSEPAEVPVLVEITTEDRLRGAIVESLHWLDVGAPGRAYSTLLEALRIKGGLNK
jgi:hypothetical protein